MNIFRRFDRIPAPYSIIVTLLSMILLGGLFAVLASSTIGVVGGVAFVLGGMTSMVMKAGAEASDREVWERVRGFWSRKPH